ncbi:MAG: hypothetical protein L6Q95_20040, partial [Planctomycetes bacterium]|nr:hypothetical protein [Planctomycetota bacterium]
KLHASRGDDDTAWEVVDGFAGKHHGSSPSEALRALGASPGECTALVGAWRAYERLREIRGVEALVVPALREAGGSQLHALLFHGCALAFSAGLHALHATASSDSAARLAQVATAVETKLADLMTRIAIAITRAHGTRSTGDVVEFVSTLIVSLPVFAAAESGAEAGYIASIAGIPPDDLDAFVSARADARSSWIGGMGGRIFTEVNGILKLVPQP